MDTYNYPGKGLSLSQLVFALKEELKRAVDSPSFTLDNVSQLDRDVTTTLANIREWRNSLVHINRIPLDVLSLIPTHLQSQADRFSASYVCRHWRRTFLQYAALWSRIFLTKGEAYVKTLLERARGSPLDIIADYSAPIDTIALLSPHTQQIRSLNFTKNYWTIIRWFSEVNSGPLPLLRTLEIDAAMELRLVLHSYPVVPPSLPLFSNAVNLKRFVLRSPTSPLLSYFVFPNLTTFEISVMPAEGFRASELLNFLEASPVLQTVHMKIIARILLEDVAQRRVVVLPSVHTFSLAVNDGAPGYELAAHISCPSASHTSLTYEKYAEDMTTDQDMFMFPTVTSWNAIVRQYTRSPVELVVLEIKPPQHFVIACTLTFRSPDMTVVKLGLEVSGNIDDENEFQMSLEEMALEVFSQATRTVRDHPLFPNIKRLHIGGGVPISDYIQLRSMANDFGRLFESVGPLDELTLRGVDLRSYLTPFLGFPVFDYMEHPIVFPPIKELTISHPSMVDDEEECMAAITEFAKSQHALGVPFERVTVRARKLPAGMAEMLELLVGVADCCEERCTRAHNE